MHVAGAVAGEHDERRRVGAERAELGDRDLPVGQHLEQVGLELVVGAVDLVDEQHRRRALAWLDRPQQRPLDEEALLVQLGLERVGRRARPTRRWPRRRAGGGAGGRSPSRRRPGRRRCPRSTAGGSARRRSTPRAPWPARSCRRRPRPRAAAAGAANGEEHGRGQPLVGQVAVGREGRGDVVDGRRLDDGHRRRLATGSPATESGSGRPDGHPVRAPDVGPTRRPPGSGTTPRRRCPGAVDGRAARVHAGCDRGDAGDVRTTARPKRPGRLRATARLVGEVAAGAVYGLVAEGDGGRFDPSKVLLDPCAPRSCSRRATTAGWRRSAGVATPGRGPLAVARPPRRRGRRAGRRDAATSSTRRTSVA